MRRTIRYVIAGGVAVALQPSLVPGITSPFHVLAIVAMGMPLLENLDLEAPARAGRPPGRDGRSCSRSRHSTCGTGRGRR